MCTLTVFSNNVIRTRANARLFFLSTKLSLSDFKKNILDAAKGKYAIRHMHIL